jgi:nitrite reductase (NO-forming)
LTCIKAAGPGIRYSAAMSTRDPAPVRPPRTPLLVRLTYGQLALAVLAFAAVPVLALKKVQSPDVLAVAPASADTIDAAVDSVASPVAALASAHPLARGEELFGQSCAACHQPTGAGIPGVFPPLAKSDFLLADPERAVGVVLHGLSGLVTVNGVAYQSAMPALPLEDADVAAILSYVNQAWGNEGAPVTAETVARVRAAGPKS